MVLTFEYIAQSFESEDKILWCDNSNKTSMVVLHIFFFFHIVQILIKINFGIFATLRVKG